MCSNQNSNNNKSVKPWRKDSVDLRPNERQRQRQRLTKTHTERTAQSCGTRISWQGLRQGVMWMGLCFLNDYSGSNGEEKLGVDTARIGVDSICPWSFK